MPCAVKGDDEHTDRRLRHIERRPHEDTFTGVGLAYRYGRVMQAISGRAFQLFVSRAVLAGAGRPGPERAIRARPSARTTYFALLRNYRRHGWIVLYLFGNSPAICESFLGGRQGRRASKELLPGTLYAPYATSLRMSDLGYRNKNQAGLSVSVNSLEHYVRDLTRTRSRRRIPTTSRSASRSMASTAS